MSRLIRRGLARRTPAQLRRCIQDPAMVEIIDTYGAQTFVDIRDRKAMITLMGKTDFDKHEGYLIYLLKDYDRTKEVRP